MISNINLENVRYEIFGDTATHPYIVHKCEDEPLYEDFEYAYRISFTIDTIAGGRDLFFRDGLIGRMYFTTNPEDADVLSLYAESPGVNFGVSSSNDVNIEHMSKVINLVDPSSDILVGNVRVNDEDATIIDGNYYYETKDYTKDTAKLSVSFLNDAGRVESIVVDDNEVQISGSRYTVLLGETGEEKTVYINTIAADEITKHQYLLIIKRAPSTNNTLKSFVITQKGGKSNPRLFNEEGLSLQSFTPNINTYTIGMSESSTSLMFSCSASDLKAKYYYNDEELNEGTLIEVKSFYYPITIKVVAQSGDENIYTFKIKKQSDNTDIQSIVVLDDKDMAIELTQNGDTFSNLEITSTIKSFTVMAVPALSKSTLSYSPSFEYVFTQKITEIGIVSILVKSESGVERVYTVKITRGALSSDTDMIITVTGLNDGKVYSKSDASSTSDMYIYELPKSALKAVIKKIEL